MYKANRWTTLAYTIKGTKQYLEKNPEHFSRIVHDYSDDTKGLIIWKDLLEEKVILKRITIAKTLLINIYRSITI